MYVMWPQKEVVTASDKECLKDDCELCEHFWGALLVGATWEKIFQVSTFILHK